jgi:hypothetical protein
MDDYQKKFDLGYSLGKLADTKEYVKVFGTLPVGGSSEWTAFLEGAAAKEKEIYNQKYKEYKLDEFESKLKELCNQYSVSIHFGCGCCGCCGAGAFCKDIEFSFKINHEN